MKCKMILFPKKWKNWGEFESLASLNHIHTHTHTHTHNKITVKNFPGELEQVDV